jgi:hypothetical protein
MLENLRDLHVWVKAGDEMCPAYQRVRPLNMSWQGTQAAVGEVRGAKNEVAVGRTKDGIAYIGSFGLTDAEVVSAFDAALEELGDCWALVLDLRTNGGGNENSARQMAGRFCDKKKVYSQARVRDDPKDRDVAQSSGAAHARAARTVALGAPVVVLQGRRTMSSGESFVGDALAVLERDDDGDATAGASANPESSSCRRIIGQRAALERPGRGRQADRGRGLPARGEVRRDADVVHVGQGRARDGGDREAAQAGQGRAARGEAAQEVRHCGR